MTSMWRLATIEPPRLPCQWSGRNNRVRWPTNGSHRPTSAPGGTMPRTRGATSHSRGRSRQRKHRSHSRRRQPELVKVDGTRFYKVPSGPYRKPEDVVRAFGYRLQKELDRGAFGIVYMAQDLRKKMKVACKELKISATKRNELEENKTELLVLEKVRHPYVIKLYCHFVVEYEVEHRMYIFMALADGGNLHKFLEKRRPANGALDEEQCKLYFAQILCGINHMHNVGIAHRDIKLQNVLLCSNRSSISGDYILVVTDFGLSVQVKPNHNQLTYCGTPIFMAPEILEHKPYNGFAADMWALGITVFMLPALVTPFDFNKPDQAVLMNMKQGRINFGSGTGCGHFSDQFRDFVRKLLDPNPHTRLKMKQAIAHPWVVVAFRKARAKIPMLKKIIK